jgi:hypothetical protein
MLGLLALVLACTPTDAPEAPATVVAARDPILAGMAPGDSLRYTVGWSAGARATGYAVTVTASQPGWSGLPANTLTVALSLPFTAINTTAWDSTSFTACVASTLTGKPNSLPRCTTWKVIRGPGQPGPPTVDSSLVIAAVLLKPDAVALGTLATQQFCPYVRALDGKVRFISGYEGLAVCQAEYDALPAADRLPGYPTALAAHTQRIPITGTWSVAVRSARDELAHLIFAGPFPEAV